VKVLSRFASPAGFALVLLLFFVLPFVSVSCEVPGYDDVATNYTGSHLVSGTDPEVPAGLRELAKDADAPATIVDPPDPGVQVLAIVLAVLAAVGVLTVALSQVRTRLLSAAAVAGVTLAVTIVTMVVAQSNLESTLLDVMRGTGAAEEEPELLEAGIADLIHTEIGFWLMVVLLALIAVVTATLGLVGDRLRAAASKPADSGGGLGALSFGERGTDDGDPPRPDQP
jgi:hypothetical protein